jgi:peptidoglycan hydrolase CwlO-like protein
MKKILKIIIVILMVSSLMLTGLISVFAQSTPQQERYDLEQRLKELEAKIVNQERDVSVTQAERDRLRYEVSVIKTRINQLNNQVRQSQVMVQSLTGDIKKTENSIQETLTKIEDLKQKLSVTLRSIYEEDRKSTTEILLSDRSLNDFFSNSFNIEILARKSRDFLGDIIVLKVNLEEEKNLLDSKKSETEQLAKIQQLQAEESKRIQLAQEALLRETEAREAEQKKEIDSLQKEAAEIRSRMLQLTGTPSDVQMPSLGEAIDIARWVQRNTGVQPAFLIAIILQESALGRNVGQCYITDEKSGNTRSLSGRLFTRGIHPIRDLPLFFKVTSSLSRDPYKTPVSCWADVGRGPNFGWGGAMGPAQFIPSTWFLYNDNVSKILGSSADPWKIRDSFLASGLLLRDNGAASSELNAAARYFGTANLGYESTVMRRRSCLQIFIDHGTMSSECSKLVFIP